MTDLPPPSPFRRPELGRRQAPPAPPRPPRSSGLWWKLPLIGLFGVVALGAAGVVWVQMTYLSDVPPIPPREALWATGRAPGMTFLDKDDVVVAHRGPRNGRPARLVEMPAYVGRAFLAAEDRRFYEHGALDPKGIARAMRVNARHGRMVQGASTLTQQLARTLLLSNEQTAKRKLQEMVIAWRLERMLSKDEVLELYLNRTFFGARAYGLSAAAETYFAKPPEKLTLGEAALLAALPKAPSRLALTKDMPAAWARAGRILAAMREMGWITPAQHRAALAYPPQLAVREPLSEGDLAYVLDAAAEQATRLAPGAPDLIVKLTVDPKLQAAGSRIVREAIAGEGKRRRASQAALVALAPDGAIRVMVGGLDHDASPFNRATQALRQPGSSFKPFVYAAALENGVGPKDVISDSVVKVGRWSPENYGGGRYGSMSVEKALALSVNTIAVKLAQKAGLDNVAELARRFGLDTIPAHPGASVALGAYEVTVLKMAGAYQVFQTGGAKTEPYLVREIADARGQVLYQRPATSGGPAFHPYQASQMVRMMEGVIDAGTGRRAKLDRVAAAKTGTSQDWRDAWFVGFTPQWLAAVWVGNDDNRSMAKVVGGEIPADIWRRFMVAAHQGVAPSDFSWLVPEVAPPAGYDPSLEDAGFAEDDGYRPEDMETPDYRLPPEPGVEDAPPEPEPLAPPPWRDAERAPETRSRWREDPRRDERPYWREDRQVEPPADDPYRSSSGPDEPQRRYRY